MPACTPTDFWSGVLVYVLPPGGALLSATALWVASRARTTSTVALSTSRVAERPSDTGRTRRGDSALARAARGRKKS